MSWKRWGGFPEEGPLGRELRACWSYPGGGRGGGRGETSRENARSSGEREREAGGAGWCRGCRGYGAHLEDQAERARIKADPPLSPLIRIIRFSLSTLARFTGLSAHPPHTLPLEADVASFHFQEPQPCPQRAEHTGCTLGTLLSDTEGPGEGRRGKQAGGGLVSRHQSKETVLRILQHQTATVAFYTAFPAPSHFSSTYCGHTPPLIPEADKLHQLKDPTRHLAQAFLQFICQPNHLHHETPHKRALQTETNQR